MLGNLRKKISDWMLEKSGYVLFPPPKPSMKGPQPRLITREQYEAIKKMSEERGDTDVGLLQTNEIGADK